MFLIRVSDDGDVEVRHADEMPAYETCVVKRTAEEAVRELVDYGVERTDAVAAVDAAEETGEWVEL